MQVLPVNLTAIITIVMAFATVLIPILGFTARFALKPLVEALGGFFDRKGAEETIALLERRMDLLQQELDSVHDKVQRLEQVKDFHAQLAGSERGALPPPPQGP